MQVPREIGPWIAAALMLFMTTSVGPLGVAGQTPGTRPDCAVATPRSAATPGWTGTPTNIEESRITLEGDAGEALVWDGGGTQGVVLVHGAIYDARSWDDQALTMARAGLVVIAVERAAAEPIVVAATYLRNQKGTETITLVGASAGGGAVLSALAADAALADGLVLLSAAGEVSGLGAYPKLFIASEGEGIAGRTGEMAGTAPGGDNQALIVPGDAHAQAIFQTSQGEQLLREMIDFMVAGCG